MMAKISTSQSLFQVYYLGQLEADRRLSSAVIPWLIEERKLKPEEMQRVWFTSGPSGVAYVADSGEELLRHKYDNILRCGRGTDSISFAYLSVSDKTDKCHCHVFQSLDLEEANMILQQLRAHEVDVDNNRNPVILSDDVVEQLSKSNKKHLQKLHKSLSVSGSSLSDSAFQLTYCGSMAVEFSKLTGPMVDSLVHHLGEDNKDSPGYKKRKKKVDRGVRWLSRKKRHEVAKSPKVNAMFRPATPDSVPGDLEQGVDVVDFHPTTASELPMRSSTADYPTNMPIDIVRRPRATSDVHLCPPNSRLSDIHSHGSYPDVRAHSSLTSSLRETDSGVRRSSVSLHSAASGSSIEAGSSSVDLNETLRAADNGDDDDDDDDDEEDEEGVDELDGDNLLQEFDELPELQQLSSNPAFVSLGDGLGMEHARLAQEQLSGHVSAKLTISGLRMNITSFGSEETVVLLDVSTQMVPCCSQGQLAKAYVAFLLRQKGSKTYRLHLLRASNEKSGTAVLKAFKSAFDQCMLATLPSALCSTCPLLVLNNLCRDLNKHGTDVQEAQSCLQDFLSTLPDADYTVLKKHYRQEPFENEHSQLVRWVTLLLSFQQNKQLHHTHSLSSPQRKGQQKRPSSAGTKGVPPVRPTPRMVVLQSTLSSSLDNMRDHHGSDSTEVSKQADTQQTATTSSHNRPLHDSGHSSRDRTPSPLVFSSSIQSPPEKKDKVLHSPVRFSLSNVFQKPLSPFTKRKFGSSRPRTETGSPELSSTPIGRGHRRTMSWRQQIFESVSLETESGVDRRATLQRSIIEPSVSKAAISFREEEEETEEEDVSPRRKIRQRWQWAIKQQLLLIRMEKANQNVLRATEAALKRYHMFYKDPMVNDDEVGVVWSEILQQSNPSSDSLLAALKMGVPQKMRFKVWQKLALLCVPGDSSLPAGLDRHSYQQHCNTTPLNEYVAIISADVGRSYPTHPYFSVEMEGGQKALYDLLCAYSVADKEIGYCQGLSFVAGLLLIHADEEDEVFELLCQLMYKHELRKLYASDMFNLQIRLYQLSRLMHDHLPDLYSHLEDHDVTPFLYAAPWFLALFCSQFPLPFISRVMDFILYEGIVAVFKVSLCLLKYHQRDIMALQQMELICDYLKVSLPASVKSGSTMAELLHSAYQYPDISIKLESFETEYQVMHEMNASMKQETEVALDLESMNKLLKKNNNDLIEQLTTCRCDIASLTSEVSTLQKIVGEQQLRLERLEALSRFTPTPDPIVLISSPSDGETDTLTRSSRHI